MNKRILVGIVFGLFTSAVTAMPILSQLVPGADDVPDDGTLLFQLVDTDGFLDDSVSYLFLENAGFAATNTFGFYDYQDASNKLQIFDGADAVGASQTVGFAAGGLATSTYGSALFDDYIFGLYLTSLEGTFYSQVALNADGFDHFATFPATGTSGLAGVFDYVVGAEDLYGGGDQDYNDMVVGITDVQPAQVPVPGTLTLLGLGLLALGKRLRS